MGHSSGMTYGSPEQVQSQPVPSPTPVLELGRLVIARHTTITCAEPDRIAEAEAQALAFIGQSSLARKVLGLGESGAPDPTLIRVYAVTMYQGLFGEGMPSVKFVADVVGSPCTDDMLNARRAAFALVQSGALVFKDHQSSAQVWNGFLCPSQPSLLLLQVCYGRHPAVFTTRTLGKRTIAACHGEGILDSEEASSFPVGTKQASAQEYFRRIRRSVIGLDPLVRSFSCQLVLHLRKAELLRRGNDPKIPMVMLMIGASGTGKTHLAETAGRLSGLPFGASSATDITATGWSGLDISDVVQPMVKASASEAAAKAGICFIDEICSRRSTTGQHDPGGAPMQRCLLKMMEGTDNFIMGGRRGSWDPPTRLDTRGILWVMAGSFTGLAGVLAKQMTKNPMGFSVQGAWAKQRGSSIHEALVDWGIIPELVNRIGLIMCFPKPTVEQLMRIAISPTGVIATFNALLKAGGLDIRLTAGAIRLMAEHALESETYCRGMKAIVSRLVEDLVFDGYTSTVTIGVERVREILHSVDESATTILDAGQRDFVSQNMG